MKRLMVLEGRPLEFAKPTPLAAVLDSAMNVDPYSNQRLDDEVRKVRDFLTELTCLLVEKNVLSVSEVAALLASIGSYSSIAEIPPTTSLAGGVGDPNDISSEFS